MELGDDLRKRTPTPYPRVDGSTRGQSVRKRISGSVAGTTVHGHDDHVREEDLLEASWKAAFSLFIWLVSPVYYINFFRRCRRQREQWEAICQPFNAPYSKGRAKIMLPTYYDVHSIRKR